MLKYDTHEQAELRLADTILTYKGRAVYVRRIRPATTKRGMLVDLDYYPLVDEDGSARVDIEKVSLSLDDEDLNFRKFRVGYCNDYSTKSATFLSRSPSRQQKQGLSPRGLLSPDTNRFARNLSPNVWMGVGFEEMLNDKYPSTKEALDLVAKGTWSSVAVSNQFAVGKMKDVKAITCLLYRNVPVGVAVGKNIAAFILDDAFSYLKEVLVEEQVPYILETSNG